MKRKTKTNEKKEGKRVVKFEMEIKDG